MQRVFGAVVLALLALSAFPCRAENAQANKSIDEAPQARASAPETVAILPGVYEKGPLGAQIAAKEFLEAALTQSPFFRAGSFQIIPEARVMLTWTKDMGHAPASQSAGLPTPKDLLILGEKLGVDWVITGHALWHTRSIWIGMGPKTKSDCTVDMVIVDVKKRELSLDARQVKLGCAPSDPPLKAATALLLGLASRGLLSSTLPLTVVSGGPKTPREESAVRLAIAKAMEPWLAIHPRNEKIDTGDETNAGRIATKSDR
jgi:hypothetical protein